MSERFQGQQPKLEADIRKEYSGLLRRGRRGVDTLSSEERERLRKLGYHYLEVEKNGFEAMNTFEVLQDFEGLRKTADYYLREYPDSHDLPTVFSLLEDHEGMRDLLNRGIGVNPMSLECGTAFDAFNQPLNNHIQGFLQENKTPVATGLVNNGVDLVAIRNLSQQYDVAVPIARGGLKQGAIANLWGMPTKIIDISAHDRKVPKGKWVNPVMPEDFTGKNILLFDKDAVTGASIRHTLKMLSRFKSASIGVYFTHNVLANDQPGLGTNTEGLPTGLKIFYPKNAPLEKAGDAYIETHEKLGTLYGRRLLIEDLFLKEIHDLEKKYPKLANAMQVFISKQLSTFDSLNQFLPGVSEIRQQIIGKLNGIYRDHTSMLKTGLYDIPSSMENFERILSTTQALPVEFENEIIRARYAEQANKIAKIYEVENPHYPSNPLSAFTTAREAVKKGYNVALIVGPEGFAYEPYFRDLGIPTLAVNIPESRENEPRSIKIFDDFSLLKGRKVLIVEDDVRTGATLQKLLEYMKHDEPAQLGLYLGQPKHFQKVENIPNVFEDTFIAGENSSPITQSEDFKEFLKSKGLKIFKTI